MHAFGASDKYSKPPRAAYNTRAGYTAGAMHTSPSFSSALGRSSSPPSHHSLNEVTGSFSQRGPLRSIRAQ